MKVLITGVTGFAGSHLLDYLTSIGGWHAQSHLGISEIKVYGTKRPRSPLGNIQSPIELIDCDITDYHSVTSVLERILPDRIYHLASQSFVPLSWSAPQLTFEVNLVGTLNILEAAKRLRPTPRILFAGSSEEYGLVAPHHCPITEDQPLFPLSPYGVSKVAGELACRQYVRSYGMHVVTTRAFNHTGPRRGELFATSNFAKQIALIEKEKQEPVIHVGNLMAQRDWTDVRDVVKAYWLAIEKCKPGEPYNICRGIPISIQGMLDMLLNLSIVKPQIKRDPTRMRPSDVPLLHGSSLKFRKKTGWRPKYTFAQTLEDLLNYWRERV